MKTTEYLNSKIIKYQNPSNGIQRRDYKRIWDALTGKWFMYPTAIGVGMNLINY
jgi:hypothetical protein